MGEFHERVDIQTIGNIHHLSHQAETDRTTSKEWVVKLIIALWDHLHQIWTFWNGVLHENNQGHIARYKVEALQWKIELVWDRYNLQQGRIYTTTQGHFQQREIINNLRHDSKACWTTMATLYLVETENTTALGNPRLETFFVWRSGIG
jgi:hypothetical protein